MTRCIVFHTFPFVEVPATIRRLRESRQLLPAALARRAKVGRIPLLRIEHGTQDPSLNTLERFAKTLRVKV